MQARLPEAVDGLFRYLSETGRRYLQRFSSAAEIDRLDGPERARIANDLGISSDALRVLAAKDKTAADLLLRRMKSVGLDPRDTDPGVMRDLERCCSMCRDKVLCVHELEDKPRQAAWPKYCPNEQTLHALLDERQTRLETSS